MAVETLKLEIVATNKTAINALQQLSKSITNVEQNSTKAETSIKKFNQSASHSEQAVKKNTQAWLNWGRVVQDAPYGLNGIANNLTQVIPAVGALGFAFSALISVMTFSQIGFGAWTKSSKKAKEESEKFRESLAEEQTELRSLYIIATNANVPIEVRRKAVKDLREQYGNYFKDLSDEQIMLGKAKTAYDNLTSAIIKNAKAQAAKSKITELSAEVLKQEEKIAQLREQGEKAGDGTAISAGGTNVGGYQKFTDAITLQKERLAQLRGEANKSREAIESLNKQIAFYEKTIVDNATKSFTEDLKEGAEEASEFSRILQKLNLRLKDTKSLGLQSIISGDVRDPNNQAPERTFGTPVTEMRKNGPKFFDIETTDEVKKSKNAIQSYNDAVNQAFQLTNRFGGVFSDLGTALLQGQAFGEALGNVFKKLAADIAAAAVKALIFKAILAALPGGPAAASAGAAPSFGDLFKGFLGIRAASGGITQGPTPALVGEAGPEAILPLDKLGAFVDRAARIGANSMGGSKEINITGELVARGQDMVLVFNRANYNLGLRR